MAQITVINNSPTRITQPSSVGQAEFHSRFAIHLRRSAYFANTVSMTVASLVECLLDDPLSQRHRRHRPATTASALLALVTLQDAFTGRLPSPQSLLNKKDRKSMNSGPEDLKTIASLPTTTALGPRKSG